MRNFVVVASALALSALSMTPALAQPGATLAAGGYSGMTCGEFTKMTPMHRAALVREMTGSGPTLGLSSIMSRTRHGTDVTNQGDTGSVAGTPLTSGMIISACQAATPATPIGNAYSQANSGGGSLHLGR